MWHCYVLAPLWNLRPPTGPTGDFFLAPSLAYIRPATGSRRDDKVKFFKLQLVVELYLWPDSSATLWPLRHSVPICWRLAEVFTPIIDELPMSTWRRCVFRIYYDYRERPSSHPCNRGHGLASMWSPVTVPETYFPPSVWRELRIFAWKAKPFPNARSLSHS